MEELLLKLKVIGKLSSHDNSECKLRGVTGNHPSVDPGFKFGFLSRWWNGDSSESTVQFITRTFYDCAQLVDLNTQSTFLYITESRSDDVSEYQRVKANEIIITLVAISKELEKAIEGLDILQTTYKNDYRVTGKLDIQKVKAQRIIIKIAEHVERFSERFNK